MLTEGVTYEFTLTPKDNGVNFTWPYTATTADGQAHEVKLDRSPAGDTSGAQSYYGIWLTFAATDLGNAKLVNVSCTEVETGKDLGVVSNTTSMVVSQPGDDEGGNGDGGNEEEAAQYVVDITDLQRGFLYNKETTDKGVVFTYTVEEAAGSLSQNGLIGTSDYTQEYPYTKGSLKYNEGVDPTMLTEGVTYKFIITPASSGSGIKSEYIATKANGEAYTVNLTQTATPDAKAQLQYYGIWLVFSTTGLGNAKLTNVSCTEVGTGRDLGVASNARLMEVLTEDGSSTTEGVDQKTPEELGFAGVTLKDFGLPYGEYKDGVGLQAGKYSGKTLDGKYLNVNIKNSAPANTIEESYINFAGNEQNGWLGIRFLTMENSICVGSTVLWREDGITRIPLKSVNMNSATEQYNLKLGVKVSGEDVIVEIWINDIRVEPITFAKGATQFGNYIGIYAKGTDIKLSHPGIVIGDDNEEGVSEQLPSDYRYFTFASVKIADGTYSQKMVSGKYAFNFNKTIFSGDVLFNSAAKSDFRYGGKLSGWDGLRFYVRNGTLYMEEVQGHIDMDYAFSPIVAGVMFSTEQFNLKLSCEFMDSDGDRKKDDVKLGVWFNDVLYDNAYIYLTDYANHIGKYIAAYAFMDVESARMTVKSDSSVYTGVDYTVYGFTKDWRKELGL